MAFWRQLISMNSSLTRWLLCLAAAGSLRAAAITFSVPFNLGPGETAFGLSLPQFDPASHPTTPNLIQVTVTLEASFGGGLTFFNDTLTPLSASGTLTGARVLATPITSGILAPGPVNLLISGSASVPAEGEASLSPLSSGSAASSSTAAGVLDLFKGTGSVSYDVDFTALYPPKVTTTPSSVTCIVCNDRVTGTLKVTYSASSPPPTGSVLLAFGAGAIGPVSVALNWRTGVESNLIGFLLERQVAGGDWGRITPTLIPALGGGRPNAYGLADTLPVPTQEVRYRLLGVDLEGRPAVLGETALAVAPTLEAALVGANLTLNLTGQPGGKVAIETALDVAAGPWLPLATVPLDTAGKGSHLLSVTGDEPARFYRLIAVE